MKKKEQWEIEELDVFFWPSFLFTKCSYEGDLAAISNILKTWIFLDYYDSDNDDEIVYVTTWVDEDDNNGSISYVDKDNGNNYVASTDDADDEEEDEHHNSLYHLNMKRFFGHCLYY